MLPRVAVGSLLTAVLLATPARAADPVMPLSQVRAGMQCTGLSVVRGTEISSFAVEVLDVVDGEPAGGGARILIRAFGPAVEGSGLGAGFSGSPILCPDTQGVARNIGAVSAAIGEYGNEIALATPIEAILGNPVDAPSAPGDRALVARARPLAAPLTVSGLSPGLGVRLQRLAARHGRVLLATPAGPLASFPRQTLRPGASLGVSYSNGDLRLSAIGTVSYVDGASVWGFGHPFEGLGRRSLFLQDAYVYRVVDNPLGLPGAASYKLAATGHDLGTLTNDALDAVAGRLGALPETVPVRVRATDLDTGRHERVSTDVADETGIDEPAGISALSLLAPLAISQAAVTVLSGSPARLTGRACFAFAVREAKDPVRFCNRYVTEEADYSGTGNAVASRAASDALTALGLLESYRLGELHVREVSARVTIRRGQRLAFLRAVRLPRRVRAGRRVRATLVLRHVRGPRERRRVTLRLPRDLVPGRRRLRFTGTGLDAGSGDLFGDLGLIFAGPAGDGGPGPASIRKVLRAVRRIHRYDGLRVRAGGSSRGRPAYRDPDLRIAGRASVRVRVLG